MYIIPYSIFIYKMIEVTMLCVFYHLIEVHEARFEPAIGIWTGHLRLLWLWLWLLTKVMKWLAVWHVLRRQWCVIVHPVIEWQLACLTFKTMDFLSQCFVQSWDSDSESVSRLDTIDIDRDSDRYQWSSKENILKN